jgi:DNA-binding MarR family transcriptional regulator
MRIEAFLRESPLFAVTTLARRFEALTASVLADDKLSFLEALILAAIFFEAPRPVRPSSLADTFGTTRGNISHCVSSLEARDLLQRRIDPQDARAYCLTLKPQGRKAALRVIGAFDKLQRIFERDTGKAALREMLASLRSVEAAYTSAAARNRGAHAPSS